ncbi:hypothetical protein GA0115256_11198 [Streptomyces sp. DconLS]|nr:hypothetical protein GA0115256_11198 [Streptomyces sp. DconLS]
MLSCVFSPNPLRSASRSASIAAASSLTEEMCRSSYSRSAFFGPSVGMVINSRTPAGILARRSSTAAIFPVRRYSTTFSAIDRPTFGISRSPFSSSFETSAGYPPTARAAFS